MSVSIQWVSTGRVGGRGAMGGSVGGRGAMGGRVGGRGAMGGSAVGNALSDLKVTPGIHCLLL